MKKKLLTAMIACLLVCATVFSLVACNSKPQGSEGESGNGNGETCTEHSYGEWVVTKPATCKEKGEQTATCTVCQQQITQEIAITGHNNVDGICTVCERIDLPASVGLEFESNGDGTCKLKGMGTCTDTTVVIPETSPENDRVTEIWGSIGWDESSGAFSFNETVKQVLIPNSVTLIQSAAFIGCTSLEKINIPSSVTQINLMAFYLADGVIEKEGGVSYVDNWVIGIDANAKDVVLRDGTVGFATYAAMDCAELESIVIPDSVKGIADLVFADCVNLKQVILGKGIQSIGMNAFSETKLTRVVLPEGVTSLGFAAFAMCPELKEVVIPKSLTNVEMGAFADCTALTDVYYRGSEAEWAKITMNTYNESLTGANVHFNYAE